MKKRALIATAVTLLVALSCSIAWSQSSSGEVYLAGFMLLRIRCGAGPYTLEDRVSKLQHRANDLLELGKHVTAFTVKKTGSDVAIYADKDIFLTVAPGDAKANGTTVGSLAQTWAQRIREIYPQATPEKPGVGRAE